MVMGLKRVVVTGGCGFIGCNFIRNYIDQYKILNIDKLTYAANPQYLADLKDHPNYSFEKLDVAQVVTVAKLLEEFEPDCIVHLAAESHVDNSIAAPGTFISTNVLGTYFLLEAALSYWKSKKKPEDFRFVYISTDEVYGALSDDDSKFSISDPFLPNSPYAASKAAGDHFVRSWHKTYGLPTITTHCSNNYGPYQFKEKFIPVVIENAAKIKTIPVYGDGSNIRDWIHVDDHCEGIQKAMEHGIPGSIYNFGGDCEISNFNLACMICDIIHDKLDVKNTPNIRKEQITFTTDRLGHDFRYAVDYQQANDSLGFEPRTNFTESLKDTVDWYLKEIGK